MKGESSRCGVRVLRLDEINVYPEYQRVPRTGVRGIVKNYNPRAVGIVSVAKRPDGSFWLMDGLQRVTALQQLGIETVRADVIPCDTVQEEAELFGLLNKRVSLTAIELFNAHIIGQHGDAIAVKKIAESHGFTVPTRRVRGDRTDETKARELACVGALLRAYRRIGWDGLNAILGALAQLWPGDPLRTHHDIIGGLWVWYSRHKGQADMKRLVARLSKFTPQRLIATGSLGLGGRSENLTDAIERLYDPKGASKQGSK